MNVRRGAKVLPAGRTRDPDGKIVEIKDTEMFCPENVHEVEIEGLGRLEAFPNGDALKYADLLGIKRYGLQNMGRYVLRWPGHCAFWNLRDLETGFTAMSRTVGYTASIGALMIGTGKITQRGLLSPVTDIPY